MVLHARLLGVNLLIILIPVISLILHTKYNVEPSWLFLGSNVLSASLDYGAVFFSVNSDSGGAELWTVKQLF